LVAHHAARRGHTTRRESGLLEPMDAGEAGKWPVPVASPWTRPA
jgi:hypothetical protein